MEYWLDLAKELGFDTALTLDPEILQPLAAVREMCAADKCRAYGRNWTCPPACGSLEDCAQRMRGYRQGILVQTVGKLRKSIDTKAYRETELRHLEQFEQLCAALRQTYPQSLCLGTGGCRICKICAYPEACRFPDKAVSSMEAYGLFVTQVCRDCGAEYHHGPMTVTYTACILF